MKIMLIGSFNGNNYGDNAILHSIIEQIENVYGSECKIYIPCSNTNYVRKKYTGKDHVIPVNINMKTGAIRFFSLQTLLTLFKVDKIATTAGILFDYNSHRFLRNSFVVSLTPLFVVARLLKKEIIGLNVGVINNNTRGRWFLKIVLNQHDILYLREPSDKHVLNGMNVKTKSVDSADIVFTNNILKKYSKEPVKKHKKIIGINLNQYLNQYSKEETKLTKVSFVKLISSNLDKMIEKYSATIFFFPTAKMDEEIHRLVIQKVKSKEYCKLISSDDFENLVNIMGSIDLLIGMRMHSLIFATILERPIISLNYSPKVEDLMEQLNLSKLSLNINELNEDSLFDTVEKVFSDYSYYFELQKQNTSTLARRAGISVQSLKKN